MLIYIYIYIYPWCGALLAGAPFQGLRAGDAQPPPGPFRRGSAVTGAQINLRVLGLPSRGVVMYRLVVNFKNSSEFVGRTVRMTCTVRRSPRRPAMQLFGFIIKTKHTKTPTQATPSFIHYHRTGTVSVRSRAAVSARRHVGRKNRSWFIEPPFFCTLRVACARTCEFFNHLRVACARTCEFVQRML